MSSKSTRKLALPWAKVLGLSALLLGLYGLLQIRIPCTTAVEYYLNHHAPNLARQVHFKLKKASLDFTGDLHLHELRLGRPQLLRVNHAALNLSLWSLLQGNLDMESLKADSLVVSSEELTPFLQEWKYLGPEKNQLWESIDVSQSTALLGHLVIRMGADTNRVDLEKIKVKISKFSQGELEYEISTKKLIRPGWPPVKRTTLAGTLTGKTLKADKILASTQSGDLTGEFAYQWKNSKLAGDIRFKEFNLNRLTESGFFGQGKVGGHLSGTLKLNGKWGDLNTFKSVVDIQGQNITAAGLPFQHDKVITSFMPELQEVNFNTLSIQKIQIQDTKIFIDGIKGTGDPLSIEGSGSIAFDGELYFKLLCHLTEQYYQALQPIVKNGIRKDEEDKRYFRCEIVGTLQKQKIKLDKVVGQVVKTNLRKIGQGLKNLFK